MGLSKSKPKPSKGEEHRKEPPREPVHSASRPKAKPMEKPAPDTRQPDREAEKPTEGHQPGKGAARWPGPSSSAEEKPDAVKEKSSKKRLVIPHIVITRASTEALASQSSLDMVEQRTIREQPDWGPYCRHRNPSTADAYGASAQQ